MNWQIKLVRARVLQKWRKVQSRKKIPNWIFCTQSLIADGLNVGHGSEVVVRRCSGKKVFLEISLNSQENTCARDFLNKVAGLRQKKTSLARCFPVNFAKLLRTSYLQNTSGGCFRRLIRNKKWNMPIVVEITWNRCQKFPFWNAERPF